MNERSRPYVETDNVTMERMIDEAIFEERVARIEREENERERYKAALCEGDDFEAPSGFVSLDLVEGEDYDWMEPIDLSDEPPIAEDAYLDSSWEDRFDLGDGPEDWD